jgi:hypothetical protein
VPRRRVAHIAGVIALLCVVLFAPTSAARADAIPCGLLSACPSPPVSGPPPANTPSPTPEPGKLTVTFDGHVGAGRAAQIQVQNGKVTASDIAFFHGRCSDGGTYVSEIGVKLAHPAAIAGAGTAAYALSFTKAHTYNKRGKRVEGHEAMAVKLSGVTGGQATVRFRDTFRSGRYSCDSGSQSITAYPLGSAQAPRTDGQASTGDYRNTVVLHAGRTTKREGLRISVYLPWGVMTDTRFSWVIDCGGHRGIETSEFGPLLITRRTGVDTFSAHGGGTLHFKGGIHGDYTYSANGQFQSATTASLVWSYQESDYRGSAFVGSCTGNSALTAKLSG